MEEPKVIEEDKATREDILAGYEFPLLGLTKEQWADILSYRNDWPLHGWEQIVDGKD